MMTDDWFWTPEWQAAEREVDEEFARGDFEVFSSVEEVAAWLMAPDEDAP